MTPYVAVIGGINLDLKGVPHGKLLPATSNPGHLNLSAGGVGRNIAHNLALLGVPVSLFGAVGDDAFGVRVLTETQAAGVNVTCVQLVKASQTGMYLSILNESHDLAVAISDMEITRFVDTGYLEIHREQIRRSKFVVIDTNLGTRALNFVLDLCQHEQIPCLINPVSVEKAKKLHDLTAEVDYITPNRMELEVVCHRKIAHLEQLEDACAQLSNQYRHILVTLGADGVYSYRRKEQRGKLFPALKTQVVDPNGAGDAFIAGFVCGVFREFEVDVCVRLGIAAAHLTLQSADTVNKNLSFERCMTL